MEWSVILWCAAVLKSHSIKGFMCQAHKALSKDELGRVKTGK